MARSQPTGSSFIVCLYKGKDDALDRGNYRGLKLTKQAMKILKRIVNSLIRQVVSIDDSQFCFVQGKGTTDAIFVVREISSNEQEALYGLHIHKAFDSVAWKVIWWALRKLGVEEWIVRLVQGMYALPKLTWKKLTEKNCRELKLTTVDPQERGTWRSGVRSAMRAASQLPG